MTATALFDALAATWPAAETRRLGNWTLRRGDGGGNRVSAATLDGPPGVAPDASVEGAPGGLDAAEAAMRAWGQRPQVLVRPGEAALDAALAARGYALRDASLIFAAPSAALAVRPLPEQAIDCAAPLACMATIWAEGGIDRPRLAVMDRAAAPKAWLLGRLGDAPAAVGFVAAHRGVAMLHALDVLPPARRQGLGALLIRAAATWAREHGASTLALAATEANAPARALYARLGLAEAVRYHYRTAREA